MSTWYDITDCDELYTIEEVAAKLRMSQRHLYRLIKEKRFPVVRIGKREMRVPANALREHIKRLTATVEHAAY